MCIMEYGSSRYIRRNRNNRGKDGRQDGLSIRSSSSFRETPRMKAFMKLHERGISNFGPLICVRPGCMVGCLGMLRWRTNSLHILWVPLTVFSEQMESVRNSCNAPVVEFIVDSSKNLESKYLLYAVKNCAIYCFKVNSPVCGLDEAFVAGVN